MKKIFVTGISGTGKTTISEELVKRGFQTISMDETENLCWWINKETKEKVDWEVELNRDFTSKHEWICDVEYLKKLLSKKDADLVFVLGCSENQDDFLDIFDKVLLLQCKPETFFKRLADRTNNDFGKHPSVQDAILVWYKDFENGLLENGAVSINTDRPLDKGSNKAS